MAISTNGTVLARLAGALYNTQMSNATYKEVAALDPSALADVLYARDFSTSTDAAVATTLVTNLGLTSVTGLNNWIAAQLTAAGSHKGAKIVDLLNSFAQMTSDATYGAYATAFNTKVDNSLALSQTTDNAGGTFGAAGVVSGKTFTLSTSVDTLVGAAGADNFTALTSTLGVGDSITGGAGNDTLTLTTNLSDPTSVAGFTTSSVEKIAVAMTDGDSANAESLTINMLNSAPTTVELSGLGTTTAADGLVLTNVAAATTLAMSNVTDLDLTATYVAAATAGTADYVTATLSGVGTTSTDTTLTIADGFEALNLQTTGSASKIDDVVFSSTGGGATLNITGDQNLTVVQALDDLKVINATEFTGKLSIVVSNPTEVTNPSTVDLTDVTVTGGSGDDTIDASAVSTAAREIYIDGGAGDDTVTIGQIVENGSTTLTADTLIGGAGTDTLAGGVDLFDAGTAGFTGTTAAANLTGISGFEVLSVSDFGTEDNTINQANLSADITQVNVTTALDTTTARGLTVNFAAGTRTVGIKGSAIFDADTLTVDAAGTAATDSLTIKNLNTVSGTNQIGADDFQIVATDFETVTLDTGSYTTATSQLVNSINIGTNTDSTAVNNKLVITGSNGLTTTATNGIITASEIDASASGALIMGAAAATGLVKLTGSAKADTLKGDSASTIYAGAGDDTVTGGTGVDSIFGEAGDDTIDAGTGNDTVDGGAGADAITSGTGNDNINGGADDDTLIFGANLATGDVANGGDGSDKLSITNASLTTVQAYNVTAATALNANITNIETVLISDSLNQTTTDAGRLAGINSFRLTGITGNEEITGLATGASVTQLAAPDASSDVLTLTVNGAAASATDTVTVTFAVSAGQDNGVLALADVETINIVVTETTASATIRANTVGLSLSATTVANGGSGAAQTVNISGKESLTVDTAIAAATIDASGLTVVAATDAGLTMSTAHTAAQSITGSGKVDTLYGSTKADTINAGAGVDTVYGGAGNDVINGQDGNDSLYGGTGSDTIDGGAGTDTFIGATDLTDTATEGAGTGDTVGVVVNLSASAITNATVLSVTGKDLSGQVTSVASGQVAYLFTGSLNTNSNAIDTLTSIENITLADGVNYIVGSATANALTGGTGVDTISAGDGADTVTGGTGSDVLTGGDGADTFVFGTTGSVSGTDLDAITDFASASDILSFTAVTVLAADTNGTTAISDVDTSTGGKITFAVADDTLAEMITAVLADAQLDVAGSTAFFEFSGDTYVYNAGAATGGTDDQIVKLTGVTGLLTITDLGTTLTIA
jgi:Ca2+-binding RTX toxin-like protein